MTPSLGCLPLGSRQPPHEVDFIQRPSGNFGANSTPREVSVRKGGIFRTGKEIEGLRGGVPWYAAQASPKIDAARTEKDPFRMETNLRGLAPCCLCCALWMLQNWRKTMETHMLDQRILL